MKELEHNPVINYVDVESVVKALANPKFRKDTETLEDTRAWRVIKRNVEVIDPALYKQIQTLDAVKLRKEGYTIFALCLGLLQD